MTTKEEPHVRIVEQPGKKAVRFRYECEGQSFSLIPGINSTLQNKTFPTIEVVGYKGPARVWVSCVTKDPPYRPHPHKLVGTSACEGGVLTSEIPDNMRFTLANVGVQCVKRNQIEESLKMRKKIRVDPYKTGFDYSFEPKDLDINVIRLCFQVYLKDYNGGAMLCQPVVTDPIYDKKALADLIIYCLSHYAISVNGEVVILWCEKVSKDDIEIRFYEEQGGQIIWEAYCTIVHMELHKQVAITYKAPPYHNTNIKEPVKVYIQLKKPSDGSTSQALYFYYIPLKHHMPLRQQAQNVKSQVKELIETNRLQSSTFMPVHNNEQKVDQAFAVNDIVLPISSTNNQDNTMNTMNWFDQTGSSQQVVWSTPFEQLQPGQQRQFHNKSTNFENVFDVAQQQQQQKFLSEFYNISNNTNSSSKNNDNDENVCLQSRSSQQVAWNIFSNPSQPQQLQPPQQQLNLEFHNNSPNNSSNSNSNSKSNDNVENIFLQPGSSQQVARNVFSNHLHQQPSQQQLNLEFYNNSSNSKGDVNNLVHMAWEASNSLSQQEQHQFMLPVHSNYSYEATNLIEMSESSHQAAGNLSVMPLQQQQQQHYASHLRDNSNNNSYHTYFSNSHHNMFVE